MIGEKWLSDVMFTTVRTNVNLNKLRCAVDEDYTVGELGRVINTPEMNEFTVRAWLSRAQGRKSTMVFCVDLNHTRDLSRTFQRHGVDARCISSLTPILERSETLDAFKKGDFPVLINCAVFIEGTDIPNIDCILLARPTKSRNLLVQMIGRGMRLCAGKQNCHVIDMVSALATGIVTSPTLFGLDPAQIVKEASVNEMKEMGRRKQEIGNGPGSPGNTSAGSPGDVSNVAVTFTDYETVQDLVLDTSGERHIRAISRLAWVQVGEDRYILSEKDGGFLTIEPDREGIEGFVIRYVDRVRKPGPGWWPFKRSEEIGTATEFEDAVHAADTFAKAEFQWVMVNSKEAWRRSPASSGQLDFLNKVLPANKGFTSDTITKGQAWDMITKFKFGAKGRFLKIKKQGRKDEREEDRAARAREMRERETVRVGPLNA